MTLRSLLLSASLILFIASISIAQDTKYYNLKKNIAIGGYDPVSYFDNLPTEGDMKHSVTNQGVTYLFTSEKNKDKFEGNYEKYIPQYGGWCAYAMGASGDKVKIDPKTYKITNGKLYLFYNFYFTNTLESWNEDPATLQKKADANWGEITK
jgi:YHS domain-containing protein